MVEITVGQDVLHDMMYQAIVRAAMLIPSDINEALERALTQETNEIAREHIKTTLESHRLCAEDGGLLCADTGWPLFWVRIGDNIRIEGGFSNLYTMAYSVVKEATEKGRLRENMVHPLTREYTGNNTGLYIPKVEIHFDRNIDYIEIIGVTKGGGSEGFGSFFRMFTPMDGSRGAIKFILDSIKDATFAGKTCGPNVIGVGIGGTADLCMYLAKIAAVLRPVGSRHPDPRIAEMEEELLEAVQYMDRGPMGTGGITGALDVHIEYAVTHVGRLPVAIQMQCNVARRAITRFGPNGVIEHYDRPQWEYR